MLRCAFLTLLLLLCLAPLALAQPMGGRAFADSTTIEKRVTVLTDRLSLTAEQSAAVRSILYEEASLARQAMKDADGDRGAMRSAMRARIEESDRRIEALLEPDQQEAYRKYREERLQEMRQRFQGSERPKL
jgi:hypothetical protein